MPSDSPSGRPSLLKRFRNLWALSSDRPEPRPWTPDEADATGAAHTSGVSRTSASQGREDEPVPWVPPTLESPAARHRETSRPPVSTAAPARSAPSEAPAREDHPEKASEASAAAEQEPMPQSPHQVLRGRIAQLLEKHPENAARLIRSLWVEDRQTEEAERDAGSSECPARVAVVMIAMGQEATAGVMKYLSDLEIERIAQAISALDVVTTEHEDEVLEEFEQLLMAGKYLSQGGIDFARGALEKALGPRKAEQLLARVTGTATEGFSLLRNIDAKHLVPFLAKEHPQTIALILSQLGPEQAATVLAELPKALQADVSFRIASMENIPPQVLRELEEGLADELHALLAGQIAEVGGPRALAEILNQADRATEEAVLTRLDAQSCELAEAVRSEMVRFDDIADLPDREIQMLLREVETKDLAVALKGASEELKSRILSNMSERVGGMIVEEMEQVGPLPKPEVERMQTGILRKLRELEEQGQITVVRGERI